MLDKSVRVLAHALEDFVGGLLARGFRGFGGDGQWVDQCLSKRNNRMNYNMFWSDFQAGVCTAGGRVSLTRYVKQFMYKRL